MIIMITLMVVLINYDINNNSKNNDEYNVDNTCKKAMRTVNDNKKNIITILLLYIKSNSNILTSKLYSHHMHNMYTIETRQSH